jgi:hypothetical protein
MKMKMKRLNISDNTIEHRKQFDEEDESEVEFRKKLKRMNKKELSFDFQKKKLKVLEDYSS